MNAMLHGCRLLRTLSSSHVDDTNPRDHARLGEGSDVSVLKLFETGVISDRLDCPYFKIGDNRLNAM